jgi:hypothetical protein
MYAVLVAAVTMLKMIMTTGLSEMKKNMIFAGYIFMSHLVINHLETDKCLFVNINVSCYFLCNFV